MVAQMILVHLVGVRIPAGELGSTPKVVGSTPKVVE